MENVSDPVLPDPVGIAPINRFQSQKNKSPQPLRKRMIRTLQVLVALFLLNYVVLPAVANLRLAWERLSEVNAAFLLAGFVLEASALVAYSQLTKAVLSPTDLRLGTLVRIQLATKAVTNLVPGGSAAGGALGYRLITLAGVDSAGAGFALAAVGMGSAAVLNVLLWLALLISIPISGVNPAYVTAALVGVMLLGAFATVLIALVKGADRAESLVRRFSSNFSFVDPERVGGLIRRLGERIQDLASKPDVLRSLLFWAIFNWLLDAASLWMFLRAFGESVRPDALLVAFCVANISAAIPLTPGGLGVLDTTLGLMLGFFGVIGTVIALGIPTYRLASYWLPIPLGALAYFSLRIGPWRIERLASLRPLRHEAESILATGETMFDWTDRVAVPEDESDAVAPTVPETSPVIIRADRAGDPTGPLGQVSPSAHTPKAAPRPAAPPPIVSIDDEWGD